MHFVYIDDSADEKLAVFSALAIPAHRWPETWGLVREMRGKLRDRFRIPIHRELHATDFVAGRGRISDRIIFKSTRAMIFRAVLKWMAGLPEARLFNAVLPKGRKDWAFERLVNRINRAMVAWDSYAHLICDKGDEVWIRKTVRRMSVYNPVPSKYGRWESTGESWKNIPLNRLIEDVAFKDSTESHFIQLADFAGFALLRQENPTPNILKYGLESAFDELGPILVREASTADLRGIIR